MTKVFISYRRDDTGIVTGVIRGKLTAVFGPESVFYDVDSIKYGSDYRKVIGEAVGKCDVLLAMIGRDWLEARFTEGPKQGQRRLDDPDDWVRLEIETAFARDIPVIPVMINDAALPGPDDLPESLRDLTFRNKADIRRDPDFSGDVGRLIEGVTRILGIEIAPVASVQPQQHPMEFLWSFVADVKSGTSWVAKAAVVVPLFDMLAGVSPPWPSRAAVGIVTAFAEILMFMWAFQFWTRLPETLRQRRMQINLGLLVCFVASYFVLIGFFTFTHPREGRKVKGFVFQEGIAKILRGSSSPTGVPPPPGEPVPDTPSGDPGVGTVAPPTLGELLPEAEFEAEQIWKPWSIVVMQIAFLLVWIAMFVSFAAYLGAYAVLQSKRTMAMSQPD